MSAGPPDVAGLRHTRIDHADGRPYLDRFHVADGRGFNARFHQWRSSDERTPHDHPWSNVSVVLAGDLREYGPGGPVDLHAGDVVIRDAVTPHRVEVLSDDAWTLFVTGAVARTWGFHAPSGWVAWQAWPGRGRYVEVEPPSSRKW